MILTTSVKIYQAMSRPLMAFNTVLFYSWVAWTEKENTSLTNVVWAELHCILIEVLFRVWNLLVWNEYLTFVIVSSKLGLFIVVLISSGEKEFFLNIYRFECRISLCSYGTKFYLWWYPHQWNIIECQSLINLSRDGI